MFAYKITKTDMLRTADIMMTVLFTAGVLYVASFAIIGACLVASSQPVGACRDNIAGAIVYKSVSAIIK